MSKIVEIYPRYAEITSNSSYGHTYEDILINNSLLKIEGLKLINDPELYREKGRKIKGLKIIYYPSNNNLSGEEMIQKILSKKSNGEFVVLPLNNIESQIKIDQKKYKIKYFNKKLLFLSQYPENNYQHLFFIPKNFTKKKFHLYNYYNNYNYYFDINRLNSFNNENDQRDKILAIGLFKKYMVFFFKSKCEIDGLFLVTKPIDIGVYACKILSSSIDQNKEKSIIKPNSFLIYESKSNEDLHKLIEQINFRYLFIKGFLNYYNDKYNIQNPSTYIGFFRSKEDIIFSTAQKNILKNIKMNYVILQSDDMIFGNKTVFEKEELVEINIIKNKVSNLEQKIEGMNVDLHKMSQKIEGMNVDQHKMSEKIEAIFDFISLVKPILGIKEIQENKNKEDKEKMNNKSNEETHEKEKESKIDSYNNYSTKNGSLPGNIGDSQSDNFRSSNPNNNANNKNQKSIIED